MALVAMVLIAITTITGELMVLTDGGSMAWVIHPVNYGERMA